MRRATLNACSVFMLWSLGAIAHAGPPVQGALDKQATTGTPSSCSASSWR